MVEEKIDTNKIEKGQVEEEKDKKEENKDEAVELKDRLLRLAAEFDNYKKRSNRELENSKLLGKVEFAKKILPVIDEFELAIEALKMSSEGEKGVAMVFSNFIEILKKEGLREIETKGKFDPYRHEIMLSKDSDKPEGTVIQIVRKGYMLNDIMLRPASIIVSNGKIEKKNEEK
ncbi:MAG: nucleotide exchange factor GrpE [Candidatus Micrarchaeia archaeon]